MLWGGDKTTVSGEWMGSVSIKQETGGRGKQEKTEKKKWEQGWSVTNEQSVDEEWAASDARLKDKDVKVASSAVVLYCTLQQYC